MESSKYFIGGTLLTLQLSHVSVLLGKSDNTFSDYESLLWVSRKICNYNNLHENNFMLIRGCMHNELILFGVISTT